MLSCRQYKKLPSPLFTLHVRSLRFRSLATVHAGEDEPRTATSINSTQNEEQGRESWEYIDDRIREQLYADEWQDTLPLPFLAAVSSFGAALTGCSSILDSPYSQIGPAPLSALGLLTYGSVASLCFCSIYIKSQQDKEPAAPSSWLATSQQGILYGSSILAGTSIALTVTLMTKFQGEFCAYCAASIFASLTLYGVSVFKLQDARKNLSIGSVIATTLAILGLFATYPATVTARSEIPFTEPMVTETSPDGAAALAAKLRDKGAKMYGAFWCSHCFEQKQQFGKDAVGVLPYVECYPDGYSGPKSISSACTDANVQGFPTWIINGKKIEGEWPLTFLESVLSGADPREEAKKYE